MSGNQTRTRRQWLGTCAGVAGATALAGCFDSDDTNSSAENSDEDPKNDSVNADWPMYGVDLQNTAHHPDVRGPSGTDITRRAVVDIEGRSPFPAVIADNTLYVSSTSGNIYAVDLDSEATIWNKEGFGAPNVWDNRVYGPTDNGQLYGYDTENGDVWEAKEIESVIGLGGPLPTEEGILVASHEIVWEIDPNTGEYNSVISTPDFVGGSSDWPAFQNGVFYIARSSELYAIDVHRSEIKWTFESDEQGQLSNSNPTVANGQVYVTSQNRQLHAIDAETGQEVWTVNTDEQVESSPAATDNLVYYGDSDRIVAVDNDNGSIEWEATESITGSPDDVVIAGGKCYSYNQFGIQVFDALTGDFEWAYTVTDSLDGGFTAPPTVFEGSVYIPANDDKLYAIEDG